MENGKSALDQMNELLAEKESVIDRKKQELVEYRSSLESFETDLVAKTKELQARYGYRNRLVYPNAFALSI